VSLGETRRRGDLPAPLAAFARLLDVLAGVTIALAGTALVALVVMMGWLVLGRYVLNDTPTWIERGATLAILCIAMPVAAVGVRERFHLSVLGLREALPGAIWPGHGDLVLGIGGNGCEFPHPFARHQPRLDLCAHGGGWRADGPIRGGAGVARHFRAGSAGKARSRRCLFGIGIWNQGFF